MSSISKPSELDPFACTTVSFEDIGSLDGEEFGFKARQPYMNLGLTFHAALVTAKAQLSSASGGVAVRSATIYVPGLQNSLSFRFATPQRAVGFYYRDTRATSLTVRALDALENPLEEATFPAGEGYAGFVRERADIVSIQMLAPHPSFDAADQSRTYLDDLSFASELSAESGFPSNSPRRIPYIILERSRPVPMAGASDRPVSSRPRVGPEQLEILVATRQLSSARSRKQRRLSSGTPRGRDTIPDEGDGDR